MGIEHRFSYSLKRRLLGSMKPCLLFHDPSLHHGPHSDRDAFNSFRLW